MSKSEIECPKCREKFGEDWESVPDKCPVCSYDFTNTDKDKCPYCQSDNIRGDQTFRNVRVEINGDCDDITSIKYPPKDSGVSDRKMDNVHCDRCGAEMDMEKSIEDGKWYLEPGEWKKLQSKVQVTYPCGTYPKIGDIVIFKAIDWMVKDFDKDKVSIERWDKKFITQVVSINKLTFNKLTFFRGANEYE